MGTMPLRSTSLAGLLALCAACDDKPTPAPSASPPEPRGGLSIDDAHVPSRATLAMGTEGDTSWRVTVASDALGCDALSSIYPSRPDKAPGTRVDFWLVRPMSPDGSLGEWSVRSAGITDEGGARGMTTRGAMIEAVSETDDQVKISGLDLACSDGERVVTFTGAVLAKNCGRVRPRAAAVAQEQLTVTIAGSRYPIAGATVREVGKRHHLRLSRAAHDCGSDVAEGFDSYLDIALEGSPPKIAFASLSGGVFPDSPTGSTGKATFVVETAESLTGTTPIEIELAGALDLSGYAVTLEGKLTAERCTPPAPPDGGAPPDQGAPKAK